MKQCKGKRNLKHYDKLPWKSTDGISGCIMKDDRWRIRGKVTLEDVQRAIRRMRNNRSPGQNGVPAEAWKHASEEAIQTLCDAMKRVLFDGDELPEDWRGGIVRFLLKKEPNSALKNWRPICLLQISYKIFTSIVNSRLQTIAEHNGVFEHTQEGFRAKRSGKRQIQRLLHIVNLLKLKDKSCVVCFLDFSNCFNSISIEAILRLACWKWALKPKT